MKKSVLTITILTSGLFVSSVLLTGGTKKEQTKEEHQHMKSDTTKQNDEMEMAYACPMHPEVTGKEGDTCSKMRYEIRTRKERRHYKNSC